MHSMVCVERRIIKILTFLLLYLSVIGMDAYSAPIVRPPGWAAEKQRLIEYGKRFASGREMYQYLKNEAGGGTQPTYATLPDWSGIWERQGSAFYYDPDQGYGFPKTPAEFVPTAKLKGKYRQMMDEVVKNAIEGRIFDEISVCGVPRGYPGNIRNPRPWEFVILPHQTWFLMETTNEVRRIYTDGRDHPPERMAFPTYDGDTIGFWDGDRLIAHTTQVREGWVSRLQPYLSDKLEGVEIWQKIDDDTIQADVWLYDPEALVEPWYTRQVYKKEQLDRQKLLRIHYWECDDPNNAITRTEGGGSTFTDFDFTTEDDVTNHNPDN